MAVGSSPTMSAILHKRVEYMEIYDVLNKEWQFATYQDAMKYAMKLNFLFGLEFQVDVTLNPTLFIVRCREK